MTSSTTPRTTVALLTVGDPVVQICRNALAAQTTTAFELCLIEKISPFNRAFQAAVDRCTTEFLIQLDEDMILFPHAVSLMETVMLNAPAEIGMILFNLHDSDRNQKIHGIKIFRASAVKQTLSRNVKASEMDLLEQLGQNGFRWTIHPEVVGRHGVMYSPQTIFSRYQSMYEKDALTWNVLTKDIERKALAFASTGDTNELFALLGSTAGICLAPFAKDSEKDSTAQLPIHIQKISEVLFKKELEVIPYSLEHKPPPPLTNDPLEFGSVDWHDMSGSLLTQAELARLKSPNLTLSDGLALASRAAQQIPANSAKKSAESQPSDPLLQYLHALSLWHHNLNSLSIAATRRAERFGFSRELCAWLLLANFKDAPVVESHLIAEVPRLLALLAPHQHRIAAIELLHEYLQPRDGQLPIAPLIRDFLDYNSRCDVTYACVEGSHDAHQSELARVSLLRRIDPRTVTPGILVLPDTMTALTYLEECEELPALLVINQELSEQPLREYRSLVKLGFTPWCELPGVTLARRFDTVATPTMFGEKTFVPIRYATNRGLTEVSTTSSTHIVQKAASTHRDSDRLHILHTVEFYAPHVGGAELVVQRVSEALVKKGHEVEVATSAVADRRSPELNGVKIHSFDVSGSMAYGINGRDIQRYSSFLQEHKADVVMHYAAQQWATDMALPLVPMNRRRVNVLAPCGYSALADYRTLRWPAFGRYFRTILPSLLPQFDACIYHSKGYQDVEFARHHKIDNEVYIPNGVDLEEFKQRAPVFLRQKYGITSKHLLLCVANFIGGKGHDRLISALRQTRLSDTTVLFMGRDGGTLASLREQASGLPIVFAEAPPRADIVAAYQEATLFIFGSLIEATPLCILEAKANRVPWVSTDCGNLRELSGGLITKLDQMPQTIEALLADQDKRRSLGEQGYREVEAEMSWPAVIDRYEALYLRLHRAAQSAQPHLEGSESRHVLKSAQVGL